MPERFDPIDIKFLLNSDDVKIESKKIKDNIKGIANNADDAKKRISKNGGVAAPLTAAGNAAEAAGAKAAAAKPKWNGLGNSINQITRELPAFTYSAQTGFLAISNNLPILADEISRIKRENDALIKSGQKGIPVWKQITKSLFSWNTALSLGVTLITIYGKEIGDFISSLFKGKEILDEHKKAVEALNNAYDSSEYQRVIADMIELRSVISLAKDGLIDKKDALNKYNETLGKAYTKTDDLNEAERIMIEKAPAYIEAMLYKAAAAEATSEAAKALAENQKKQFDTQEEINKKQKEQDEALKTGQSSANMAQGNYYSVWTASATQGLKALQTDLDNLEEEGKETQEKSSRIVESLNKKAAEIAKKAGLDIFGDKDKSGAGVDSFIDRRKKLLEKIADLDREYARKQLQRDEEELQALKDKFTKVRELIEEFNNDPKNKQAKIDITALDPIEKKATEELKYRQGTRNLEEDLKKQKAVWKEIEEFKARFGIEKAKERYGKELEQFENFVALIRQKIENNQLAFDAVQDGTATGGESDRVKLLEAYRQEELQVEREKYMDLLEEYQSYVQKRKRATELFQNEYEKLIQEQNYQEAEERKRRYQEEIDDLNDANLKRKDAYKELFQQIGRLSIEEGKRIIANARKLIETQEMSAETKARILKLIADTEEKIRNLKADQIYDIARGFDLLGQSLYNIGQDIGSPALSGMGSFLTSVAGGLADLQEAMNWDEDTTDMEKATFYMENAVRLMGIITTAAQQRKQAEEEYYLAMIGYQQDYNTALNDQIRLRSILDENVFITDYEGRITDANEALIDANEKYQESLEKLDNGRVKTGKRNAVDWGAVGQGVGAGAALGSAFGPIGTVVGGFVGGIVGLFGGKKKKDRWGDLLTEYPELVEEAANGQQKVNTALAQSLIDNGLLNDKTKQLVQNALDWQEAIEEARGQIKQVITDLSGSLSGDLRNALVDAFRNGEDAAVKMGDTVEKVLENIVSNLVFNKIFSDAFSKLEDDMAASYDIGGDQSWLDDFARFFNTAEGLNDDYLEAMQAAKDQAKAYGFDIFEPDDEPDDPRGLQGAIRRELTEETGSELTGLFRGQFDITKRHFQLHERHFELEQRHYNATISIMQSSALIEQNTAATVVQLALAVSELKKIQDNTKSTTARDIGR